VLSTLNKLSKGSAALDNAYGEAIKRIDGQLEDDRLLARRALCWISYAQRLLTTTELCHALAIEPDDRVFNVNNVYEVGDIISVCAGLVTMDDESGIIRLVHYTAQEYFERVRHEWNPSAQEGIAVACLAYLSFDVFESGRCLSNESFEQRRADNPFLDYSAHYWAEHVRPVQDSTPVSELALAFLLSDTLVDAVFQAASVSNYRYGMSFPRRTRGLHLAARCGLPYLSQRLLESGSGDKIVKVDSKDGYGREPLSYAAEGGHEAVVKLLVEAGADVDAQGGDYGNVLYGSEFGNPLYAASRGGHEAVVKLLVEAGADVDAKGERYDDNALQAASYGGHEAVVKLLVEAGANVEAGADAQGQDYGSALYTASVFGHEAVVKLLVEAGADVDAPGGHFGNVLYAPEFGNALYAASRGGHEAVVKLLVEAGADVDAKGTRFGNALQAASDHGHEAIVKLLVEAGANYIVN
jgi:ankyrin repeat protein